MGKKKCHHERHKCKTSFKDPKKQKACWDAKLKQLMAEASGSGSGSGDICDQAPAHMKKKCHHERHKCKTSFKDHKKQKACWDAKLKQLMAEASGSGSGSGDVSCKCPKIMKPVCGKD